MTGLEQPRRAYLYERRAAAAIVALLLLAVIAAGGGRPASGNEPEGSQGTFLTVTPSDALPAVATVTLRGTGFFPDFSIESNTVRVAQCLLVGGSCGPETGFQIVDGSVFDGTITVARMLTLSDTTVDCVEVECVVRATSGPSFATHHLTFSVQQSTTTTTTGRVTTTTLPPFVPTTTSTTKPPATTTTRPATSTSTSRPTASTSTTQLATTTTARSSSPSTTRGTRPTTSTSGPTATSTSTTAPPTTTTSTSTVPPPPDEDRPPLIAVTPKNEPAGPPGGGLNVAGTGYTCETVYFFFDGTRVGTGAPDDAGNVRRHGLSVPGNAEKGRHVVTSSCDASGDLVVQTASFDVLSTSVHRPAFVTALPLPGQISFDPGRLLLSAALAMGVILLIAFPFELFNSTMEENYDEIRSWVGLPPRDVNATTTRSRGVSFIALTAVAAVVCGFLSPDFGLNMTSLVLFVGMFVALVIMAVVFSLPADFGIHRQVGEWGKLNFLPGSLLVSIVLVGMSRLLDFQPGYFYGALAGLAFRSALSEKVQGKMTAANWLFSLVVSVAAFFLRAPVASAAAEPGASILWIGLEVCLVMIFLWGVEGLAVAMLPMRFLDGRKVFHWSRTAWALLFFLGLFATVHVLLQPGSGYVGETSGEVTIGVMVLYALFGLGSAAFWAYFRFRPPRWAPADA